MQCERPGCQWWVCAKDFVLDKDAVVTRGKIYCRSRRISESTEIQSPDDMRDLIDLATSKGLQRYFRLRDVERRRSSPSDADSFADQLRGLLG